MRRLSLAIFALSAVMVMCGMNGWTNIAISDASAADRDVDRDHWRYYDGHWAYWHEPDRRWYYTDGNHWFYHEGNAWRPYRFDAKFGREGFERGNYRVVREKEEITVPRHDIYRAK